MPALAKGISAATAAKGNIKRAMVERGEASGGSWLLWR
jgi:hypothetical protein